MTTATVVGVAFFISKFRSSFFRLVLLHSLHGLIKINQMTVKLRAINTGKLHLTIHHQSACAAHSGSVHHNRVHGDNGGNLKFSGEQADKLHHDHGSDGHTEIVFLTLIHKCLQLLASVSVESVGTVIRGNVQIAGNCLELVREQVEETSRRLKMLKAERVDEGDQIEVPGCTIRDYQMDPDEIVAIYKAAQEKLAPYIRDTVPMLHRAKAEGKSILMEGAQGTMLDIDFGTYPFVTSSNPTSGGACIGSGLSPRDIDCVVGVIKAYTTRVGEGPFPTELYNAVDRMDEDGKILAERGHEFGAVTKRPRRTGWYDAVVARYAQQINGVDYWALTKLDVMDVFEKIRICVAYELDGRRIDYMPTSAAELARVKPVYEEMDGWMCETSHITRMEDLPPQAKAYVDRLVELSGGKLGILSIGPARESTLRIAL